MLRLLRKVSVFGYIHFTTPSDVRIVCIFSVLAQEAQNIACAPEKGLAKIPKAEVKAQVAEGDTRKRVPFMWSPKAFVKYGFNGCVIIQK
jgi:hypothetical protein